jgi:hypothetical protein
MHFLFISLLAILAGTLLLIKTRKEALGKFFNFISWFFIVVGFILFIGFLAGGICRLTHHQMPGQPRFRHEMMMRENRQEMPAGTCCPGGKEKAKECCEKKLNCMQKDSLMKNCPMHSAGDSIKMPCAKGK